ncbi:heme NO-binding domain-containing protein [Kiloniella laminariae]|uniref:Heme NO-binding domain-containing protein n=1 Tax=Kiloniella laminariae TaxID=454162 RepID=A0ABT4LIL5_9PROT|nr:heme NO-binding domain-containing protein [Kiloniella laminariae]MCZ4279837.1 heme NO-binding domain-containing protein [Kiloniella laminariae]
MKGIVFTEFLEMVDGRFGEEFCDRLIDAADLPSGGSYTAVGTYDFNEMITLVEALSRETGKAGPDLMKLFGEYLFGSFSKRYPVFFEQKTSCFDFLTKINDVIHPEVHKLYPDAQLPHFSHDWPDDNSFVLVYQSSRPFAALAEGLIAGAIAYFGEKITLEVEDLAAGAGTMARFNLSKEPGAGPDFSSDFGPDPGHD